MNDNMEMEDNYDDMEEALEKQEISERDGKIIRNMADLIISRDQLANKGNLLGHYQSAGFCKTYIDVYERAVIGKVEPARTKKAEDIGWGYARLAEAIVEKGVLYFILNDGKFYKIRHLKMAETVAYMINGQKIKTMTGGRE